ncbi:MAG: hypothetical protein F6K31_24985 [Symploca sp. SIO2G7]|nr:hypothetical protein [Symploca sp. SIO2G7]
MEETIFFPDELLPSPQGGIKGGLPVALFLDSDDSNILVEGEFKCTLNQKSIKLNQYD